MAETAQSSILLYRGTRDGYLWQRRIAGHAMGFYRLAQNSGIRVSAGAEKVIPIYKVTAVITSFVIAAVTFLLYNMYFIGSMPCFVVLC